MYTKYIRGEELELYAIGYAGRNKDKTWEHIEELKKIGVPEPKSVPELYHLNPELLNYSDTVHIIGDETSGEVEIVLIADKDGNIEVTVGSDHTDRGLETISIQKSKQICPKPIAEETIKFDEIEDEWDDLELFSSVKKDGEWKEYQSGKVSAIVPLDEIVEFLKKHNVELKDAIVFCGTVPLLDDFVFGDAFKCGLTSNKLDKTIEIEYKINKLKE